MNYGTIYRWKPDHVPRPYQLIFDVPGEWVPERVTPKEAERLLKGEFSYMYSPKKPR